MGNMDVGLPAEISSFGEIAPHGFFAPVSRDVLEDLLKQCARDEAQIRQVESMAGAFFGTTLPHFVRGNLKEQFLTATSTVEQVFKAEGAIKHLYATYWSRALALTDVYDFMPQARRNEWNKAIEEMTTPVFNEENVIPTLRGLLLSRELFLAERVDGIFRGLSGEHVTNQPQGFGKRMIMGYMLSYFSVRHEKAGLIHDLRSVIARLTGRAGEAGGSYELNNTLITELQKTTGEWHVVDGGALRIRLYKKGTAHLEVHPDIAWKLNVILSSLYPAAIPASARSKPPKKVPTFATLQRPVPSAVLEYFCRDTRYCDGNTYSFGLEGRYIQKTPARDEAIRLMESLGGVRTPAGDFEFDYDYRPVFKALVVSGMVPDQVAYQYYPTPSEIVDQMLDAADIGEHDSVLEPSAGQGHIAAQLPADRTTCVELSALHCKVLRSKGLKTAERDFLEWAGEQLKAGMQFDRVVMNPPFSEGRARLHFDAARSLLAPTGRLVAVLPGSFRGKPAPAGWRYEYSTAIDNAFADASVSVVIVTATRTST